jgi:hypothetical protein
MSYRISAVLDVLPHKCNSGCPTGLVQFWMLYWISAIWMPYRLSAALDPLPGQWNSGCTTGSVQFWMPCRPFQCNSGCPTGTVQFWLACNLILEVFASLGEFWFHYQFGMSFQNSAIMDVISRHSMLFLSNSACMPCRMSCLTTVLSSKRFSQKIGLPLFWQ